MPQNGTWVSGLVCGVAILIGQSAGGATLNVPATSNLFGAGHASAPGGGTLPIGFVFTALPGQTVRFSPVTGTVTYETVFHQPVGPDGETIRGPSNNTTNIDSAGGISGIQADSVAFLAGVFLDNTEPAGAGPARLNFIGGRGYSTLSPLLNQSFFIGDGLTGTGSGAQQVINVPATATRLYLGLVDGSNFTGPPGQYADNEGSFNVTFSLVPEPGSAMMVGALTVGAFAWRRRGGA
jgi:hypothetical protein